MSSLYTKILPKINSIIPRVNARRSFLDPPILSAIRPPLISSSLIIQQKRTGTARPKLKKPKEKQGKALGFKRKKTKKESSEGEVTSASSSEQGSEEFYKSAPVIILNDMLPDVFTHENVGKVYQIPEEVVPKFNVFKFPTSLSKEFALFHRPSLVVRQSSVELISLLKNASTSPSTKNRFILSGSLGVGKSALLVQAISYAMCQPWIVIYIPHAIQYVNSSYPYIKVESTNEFVQPTLAVLILQQIKRVNERYLRNIKLRRSHKIHRHAIEGDKTVSQLLDVGINDPHSAQDVFEIFMEEIGNNSEYPVLLAVDEVNAFYTNSEYRDVDDSLLEVNRLSLPRTILEYFSGKKDFTYGATIGALSHNFKPFISKTLEIALGLSEASSWKPVSNTTWQYTTGLQRFDVKEYTKDEAKAIMDYYYDTAIMQQPKEQVFLKYFLATNGNPKKFYMTCWKGL
ncbi:9531_t:CDS:10 [Funneliformis geosporum]|uniref:Small ribosomal subunit protein mS29 n=1 Tax=Funneliformis geosporum TaxID=1117311 RepID=A0A9W4WNF0_9GLOM|nr:9531_t:CDS:10 [Funneliformis geosporum]